jgi:hypothetical protein
VQSPQGVHECELKRVKGLLNVRCEEENEERGVLGMSSGKPWLQYSAHHGGQLEKMGAHYS